MRILPASENRFQGIHIHPQTLPAGAADFSARLSLSLDHWREQGMRAVWLELPEELAHLIPLALQQEFEYHHCRGDRVTMTRRLVTDTPLPPFATHTIGVGGLVISAEGEILTIVERSDLETRPDNFKFPGGMLEPGEHIESGVVREVWEETDVETAFEGLLSFRHHHDGQFGTSNIYAVCKLRPVSRAIAIDEVEIGLARWMPLQEFMERPGVGLYNKHIISRALQNDFMQPHRIEGYRANADDYEIYTCS